MRAQWRDADRERAQPVVQVLAELSRLHQREQVAVARRHHARGNGDVTSGADRPDPTLGQRAHDLRLVVRPQAADLVEEEHSLPCLLPESRPDGGPILLPEQRALELIGRKRRAAHLHERLTPTVVVDAARDDFLTRSRIAENQHLLGRRCGAHDEPADQLGRARGADEPLLQLRRHLRVSQEIQHLLARHDPSQGAYGILTLLPRLACRHPQLLEEVGIGADDVDVPVVPLHGVRQQRPHAADELARVGVASADERDTVLSQQQPGELHGLVLAAPIDETVDPPQLFEIAVTNDVRGGVLLQPRAGEVLARLWIELRAQRLRVYLAAGELEDLHADPSLLSTTRRAPCDARPDRRAGFALSHERLGELKPSRDRSAFRRRPGRFERHRRSGAPDRERVQHLCGRQLAADVADEVRAPPASFPRVVRWSRGGHSGGVSVAFGRCPW